ncbi:hypothetical protein EDB86DRAFT_3083472 [Lactarius hatsudake]|nr:hypothetical protein EDB86DRAFT_3083472 [Lactarius hatsudake]
MAPAPSQTFVLLTLVDEPLPCPPRSLCCPSSPRIAQPPLPTVKDDRTQASPLSPVTKNEEAETLLASAPAPPTCSPPTPIAAPTPTPVEEKEGETLALRVIPVPTLLVTPATPCFRKCKHHDISDSDEARPHKHALAPRRATPDPIASTLSFPDPYTPPSHRPHRPPGDPIRAALNSEDRSSIVRDDNELTRGVKTLDDSVFALDSTQGAEDSPLQTPPHVHLFPCRALKEPCDSDELANRPISSQCHRNARSQILRVQPHGPDNTGQNSPKRKCHDSSAMHKAQMHHACTNKELHHTSAATPITTPPPDPTATHCRNSHALNPRQCPQVFPHRAETTETMPTTIKDRDCANAAVKRPLEQRNAAQATSYDAITEHVTYGREMPEEFCDGDEVRAFGAGTEEHWRAWRHIEASFLPDSQN